MNLLPTSELTDRQLRRFGVALVTMLLTLAALFHWKWSLSYLAVILAIGALALGCIYFGFPARQRSIYRAFQRVTRPVQWMVTIGLLGLVFLMVFVPIGWIMRLRGKSIRRVDRDSDTYWIKRSGSSDPNRYFDTY